MIVNIDESRANNLSRRIEFLGCGDVHEDAYLDNHSVFDTDVSLKSWLSRTVDDGSVAND